jgi:hypothetical protein
VNRARLRTTTAVTAAALSLSITPLIVESAWASSGGSTAASSSKRSSTHITRSGTRGAGNGTSSDEDADSAGEPRPSTNPKRTKSRSPGQKMHTKNTQKFQTVVLGELKEHSNGLSVPELRSKLVSSGSLKKFGGSHNVTQGALSALERMGAVEKIADSSPTKYKVTTAGLSLRGSLKRPPLMDDELKDEVIKLLSQEENRTEGMALHSISRRLGYSHLVTSHGREKPFDVLVQELIDEGRLTFTPEGRYIPPQNVSESN